MSKALCNLVFFYLPNSIYTSGPHSAGVVRALASLQWKHIVYVTTVVFFLQLGNSFFPSLLS